MAAIGVVAAHLRSLLESQNSRYFVTSPLGSSRKDIRGTSTEKQIFNHSGPLPRSRYANGMAYLCFLLSPHFEGNQWWFVRLRAHSNCQN